MSASYSPMLTDSNNTSEKVSVDEEKHEEVKRLDLVNNIQAR